MRLLHLGDHKLKSLGDVLVIPGTRFGPSASELGPQLSALLGRYLSLFRTQVALVSDDDQWHPFGSLQLRVIRKAGPSPNVFRVPFPTYQVVEDLVSNDADHVKGLFRGHGINEHVAVDSDEMPRVQYAVLILGAPLSMSCHNLVWNSIK